MIKGNMGYAHGITKQRRGFGIFQQNRHSQGIGQALLTNMTYVKGNSQHAEVGADM